MNPRALAFAAWMLGGVALAAATRQAGWFGAAGALGLGARVVAARGAWTPSGRLGLANLVTLSRLAAACALGVAAPRLPWWALAALVGALLALDGLDGALARARGEASAFGAALDMETDALTVMTVALVLWQTGRCGAWVLVAGLWRYGYAALVALVPSFGEAPRSRFGRAIYVALMTGLLLAFVPLPGVAPWTAGIGTALVSLSFVRSLWQSRRPAAR